EAKRAPCVRRGQAQLDEIVAGGGDVDGVFEPLASRRPAHVVAAAGVGARFDVHLFARSILTAIIWNIGIVISDARPADIEILSLDYTRDCPGCAAVRPLERG